MMDCTKYAKIGDKLRLHIDGKTFHAVVKDVTVMEYERKYLLHVESTGELLWFTNAALRPYLEVN